MSRGGARGARKLDKIIEEMHPAQREGLSIDGEDVGNQPASSPTTSELIGHMGNEHSGGLVGRLPAIKFVAEDDSNEFWSMGDDRIMAGADITVTPELYGAIEAGRVCLRCYEPQEGDFPIACGLCGYSMRELQLRDVAMEFSGFKHLGPSKPITAFADEAEEKYQKAKFERKIAEGKSPMKGLVHGT